MTPKEKAVEIYDKMKGFRVKNSHRKKCAIVAIDEIIKSDPLSPAVFNDKIEKLDAYKTCESEAYEYWQEVRQEIEKL